MLGTLLGGRYKINRVLGAGGFGQTYLAEDTQKPGNPLCVVKQFKPASQDSRFLQVARRLFQTEVQTLERLGEHDQIPELYSSFEENQEFYLAQEFIDGIPLSEEFSRIKRLSEVEVIDLLRDVLGVLEFVHNHRVIHRDIKPANLIRRHRDGRIVLIDFGAVKEIQTQLAGEGEQTSFTVGIGTQGYTPAEQLAGKPRYCSDIYALGMTAIQSLTGRQPSQLTEDPHTSELIWQEDANVSLGLAFVLDRMVRFHYTQRYQSATEVLNALDKLAQLPTNLTEIPPSMLLPADMLQGQKLLNKPQTWREKLVDGLRTVAIAAVTVTGLVTGLGYLGMLEPLELRAYDQMVRLRPVLPPDPRLLIVAITEDDLQALKRPTPTDQEVAQVMANLQQHQPRVIGLDLYRDLPQEPGQQQLLQQLNRQNVIAIMNLGNPPKTNRIEPPPGMPKERVGFNDFPIDYDGVVRRNLLFAGTGGTPYTSFSLQLVFKYLADRGIKPTSDDRDQMVINGVAFRLLESNSGGYQRVDNKGYQILLDYRSAQPVAPEVRFTDVLQGKIDPALVQDRIVLIGTTAISSRDLFNTPFSAGQEDDFKMAGVIVHAQMVSQFLSTALDGKPLFSFLPEWGELLIVFGWAIAGGLVVWFVRHPVLMGLNSVTLLIILTGTGFIIFLNQVWVPMVAPAIAFMVTAASVTAYRSYRSQQEQQELTQLFWKDKGLRALPPPHPGKW